MGPDARVVNLARRVVVLCATFFQAIANVVCRGVGIAGVYVVVWDRHVTRQDWSRRTQVSDDEYRVVAIGVVANGAASAADRRPLHASAGFVVTICVISCFTYATGQFNHERCSLKRFVRVVTDHGARYRDRPRWCVSFFRGVSGLWVGGGTWKRCTIRQVILSSLAYV